MAERALRAYMAFDRTAGPGEGAFIVFAPTAKAARRAAWRVLYVWFDTEWIDAAVRWIREGAAYHQDSERHARGETYVIDCPQWCIDCEYWFAEGYDDAGLCEGCAADLDEAPETGGAGHREARG